jgi:hypothetical protein
MSWCDSLIVGKEIGDIMDAIADIIETLETRRREYNAAIDRAIAAVREDSTKTFPVKNTEEPTAIENPQKDFLEKGHIVNGSLMDRALKLLHDAPEPLHVKEILEQLGPSVVRSHLVNVLERAKNKGVVIRTKPGTYKFLEVKKD